MPYNPSNLDSDGRSTDSIDSTSPTASSTCPGHSTSHASSPSSHRRRSSSQRDGSFESDAFDLWCEGELDPITETFDFSRSHAKATPSKSSSEGYDRELGDKRRSVLLPDVCLQTFRPPSISSAGTWASEPPTSPVSPIRESVGSFATTVSSASPPSTLARSYSSASAHTAASSITTMSDTSDGSTSTLRYAPRSPTKATISLDPVPESWDDSSFAASYSRMAHDVDGFSFPARTPASPAVPLISSGSSPRNTHDDAFRAELSSVDLKHTHDTERYQQMKHDLSTFALPRRRSPVNDAFKSFSAFSPSSPEMNDDEDITSNSIFEDMGDSEDQEDDLSRAEHDWKNLPAQLPEHDCLGAKCTHHGPHAMTVYTPSRPTSRSYLSLKSLKDAFRRSRTTRSRLGS